MMEPKQQVGLSEEIDKLTTKGNELIQSCQVADALTHFEKGYNYSRKLPDHYTQRSCAFNLGAVLIACNQAEKGLSILMHAIPPKNVSDGESNGDLYYNLALG